MIYELPNVGYSEYFQQIKQKSESSKLKVIAATAVLITVFVLIILGSLQLNLIIKHLHEMQ